MLSKLPPDGTFVRLYVKPASRFTGVGTAARSAMVAELCRVTEVKERTPILAVCNAAQQIGIFSGPAFQILFAYCHFSVFGIFEIHPLNAAGALMGVVWGLFLFAALAMYYNLTAELAKMQNSVAKTAEVRNERGMSADESTTENILKRATFSDYVNGMQLRLSNPKIRRSVQYVRVFF